MFRLLKTALAPAACLLAMLVPGVAQGFDAGVRAPVLADRSPDAVSVPFEIPIRQSTAVPQPLEFEIAVEGFGLDPAPVPGLRIGSLDMVTDAGDFDDKAIYSNGPATDGVRTWTLDWQLSNHPITATVEDRTGLAADGRKIARSDSTLISFTVPGNYHGFRLMGLILRFNQEDHGKPTAGVGAVNPAEPGNYLIRSRVLPAAPESQANVTSVWTRIGSSPSRPKTRIAVGVNRFRVHPGGLIRFSLRTVNDTTDSLTIRQDGRLLRKLKVGPDSRRFNWRLGNRFAGRKVTFRFKPRGGPAKRVAIRVKK